MNHTAFGGMPYIPLREHWICESRAFLSGDAKLVRACVRLLLAAWRGVPAGSVSPSYSNLSAITGLTEQELSAAYVDLTDGWELRDERLYHLDMHALCERLGRKHGEVVNLIAEEAAIAMQDSDLFGLQAPGGGQHKSKGARLLPNDWAPHSDTLKRLEQLGFDHAAQELLILSMVSWAKSKNEKRPDWDATLISFAAKELRDNPRRTPATGTSRFGHLMTGPGAARGDIAAEKNIQKFLREPAGSNVGEAA